jgi:Zn-dependent protease
MDFNELLKAILVYGPPMILAITLHEAAHGYVAKHFGDTTAYMLGRVTLNPIKHVDLIGTIVLPLALGWASNWSFIFGYAKPVPVNFNNLRNPKRDMLWVAAAGPGSNVVQMLLWGVVAWLLVRFTASPGPAATFWLQVAQAGISVNVVIAILNLLPLLPLDGGRIVTSLLPNRLAYQFSRLEPYGMVVLIVLIFTGVLGKVMGPAVYYSVGLVYSMFGFQ